MNKPALLEIPALILREWTAPDGLQFNRQTVSVVFELNENDNCYYSRDILFCNARRMDTTFINDMLTEYLDKHSGIKAMVADLLQKPLEKIEIFLPKKNLGAKTYNGGYFWYWIHDHGTKADDFAAVGCEGQNGNLDARYIAGAVPCFKIKHNGKSSRPKTPDKVWEQLANGGHDDDDGGGSPTDPIPSKPKDKAKCFA